MFPVLRKAITTLSILCKAQKEEMMQANFSVIYH